MPRTTRPSPVETLESRIAPATLYTVALQSDGPHLEKLFSVLGASIDLGLLHGFNSNDETVVDMDVRSATGELVLLTRDASNAGYLYTVNPLNGALSGGFQLEAANGDSYTSLPAGRLGVDFDTKTDRLRIVGIDGTNLSVDPDTETVTTLGTLTYDTGGGKPDPDGTAHLASIAYSNPLPGQDGQFYGLDLTRNTLVLIDAADPSVVHPLKSLGDLPFDDITGFDLGFDGTGYAQFLGTDDGKTASFRLDLSNIGGVTLNEGTVSDVPLLGLADQLFAATRVNDKTLTYHDIDGDLVTIKTSKGSLAAVADSLQFIMGSTPGTAQLSQLDLSAENLTAAGLSATAFKGAVITITSTSGHAGAYPLGDGFTNVGLVDTVGTSVKSLTVDGDLGAFFGGAPFLSQTPYTLSGLTVQSLGGAGQWNPLLQAVGLGVHEAGALTTLTVKSSVYAAVNVDSDLGTITIGGSIWGDPNDHSDSMPGAAIISGGKIKSITVKGSLYGGARDNDGSIHSNFGIGTVAIGGSVYGGEADLSGSIGTGGGIAKITVGGSVYGGQGENSGTIYAGPHDVFMLKPDWTLALVSIGGSLIGGEGPYSGSVFAAFGVKKMLVGGSILGSIGDHSGSVFGSIALGTISVNGDVTGGSGVTSGSIVGQFSVGSVSIRGSLSSGTEQFAHGDNGIFGGYIGSLKIGGDVRGTSTSPVNIASSGVGAVKGIAIAAVQVGGTVADALISAGVSTFGTSADVGIGTVKIGGDFVRSSVAAGVKAGADGSFGTGDAGEGQIGGQDSQKLAVIKSVTIGGQMLGTAGILDDGYAITAEQVQLVKVGGVTYKLLADQTEELPLGLTGDVKIVEFNQTIT